MNEPEFELTEVESYPDDEAEAHGFAALATVEAPSAPLAQTLVSAVVQHSRAELDALKDTIKAANRDMTDAQFTVFMAAARHLGLDPLARQVVPIFQQGKMTVQTTIDGFRLIAERTRKYRGQVGPFWCGKDGQWRDVWLEDGQPAAAKVGVKRSDFDEVMWGVARFKSYYKDSSPTWKALPDVMLAKVAESLALRKAFPAELSGAYTAEEMTVVDADPPSSTDLHNFRAERAESAPARPQAPQQSRPAADATPASARPQRAANLTEWAVGGYDPINDKATRDRLTALGYKTIAQVEEFLTGVRNAGEYTQRSIKQAVVAVEQKAHEAAQTNGYDLQATGAFAGPLPN